MHTYIGSRLGVTILSPALMGSAGILNSENKGLNAIQTACDFIIQITTSPSSLAASYMFLPDGDCFVTVLIVILLQCLELSMNGLPSQSGLFKPVVSCL